MSWKQRTIRPAFAPIDTRYRRAGLSARLRRWLGTHGLTPAGALLFVLMVMGGTVLILAAERSLR